MKYIILSFCGILFLQGCVTISAQGKLVKVVHISQESKIAKCKSLGPVVAQPGGEYGSAQDEKLLIKLKNKAGEVGANVILSDGAAKGAYSATDTSVFQRKMKGIAYSCPDSLWAELTDHSDAL